MLCCRLRPWLCVALLAPCSVAGCGPGCVSPSSPHALLPAVVLAVVLAVVPAVVLAVVPAVVPAVVLAVVMAYVVMAYVVLLAVGVAIEDSTEIWKNMQLQHRRLL